MTRLTSLPAGLFVAALVCATAPGAAAQTAPAATRTEPSTRDLSFFLGSWEGEGIFLPAFTEGAQPRPETVRAACAYVLTDTYIQCDSAWTNPRGRVRSLKLFWNFNSISGEYEGLVLDSNWSQESSFSIKWDAVENAYVGLVAARTADGRAATERTIYRIADDRRTIHGFEQIRLNDGPADAWIQTFEYVWRKVE